MKNTIPENNLQNRWIAFKEPTGLQTVGSLGPWPRYAVSMATILFLSYMATCVEFHLALAGWRDCVESCLSWGSGEFRLPSWNTEMTGVSATEIYSSQFWSLGSPPDQILSRFWWEVCISLPSPCVLTWQRGHLCVSFHIRALISLLGLHPRDLITPKSSPPNTVHLIWG